MPVATPHRAMLYCVGHGFNYALLIFVMMPNTCGGHGKPSKSTRLLIHVCMCMRVHVSAPTKHCTRLLV